MTFFINLKLKFKENTIPHAFHERFTDINHQYPNRFSQDKFAQRKIKLPRTKFNIMSRTTLSLKINILTPVQKQGTSQNIFKKSVKETLLRICNEFDYF